MPNPNLNNRDDDPSIPFPTIDTFPATGTPIHPKPSSWDFYKAMGEPKHIVAPMVDQSELAWRILSRRHGAHLVYTPMINSRRFLQNIQSNGRYEQDDFWIAKDERYQEEGSSTSVVTSDIPGSDNQSQEEKSTLEERNSDRPLIVQFAANDPDTLLQAAQAVEDHCDGVDLNFGCPQHIARRGHYGAFLQSDWNLTFQLVNTLHIHLKVPVTAKMRVFESTERTIAYALMLERAGAQIIAVHGRTREMKGHKTGLADWEKIRQVKNAVSVPVFANGNILFHEDVQRALKTTGADGVMSAEGNLYNPAIFSTPPEVNTELFPMVHSYPFPRIIRLAYEYLDICEKLQTPTASSAIKAHFFRLARPALEVHRDLRPVLGQARIDRNLKGKERLRPYRDFLDKLAKILNQDEIDATYQKRFSSEIPRTETSYIPHWFAQPYYRKEMPPADEDVNTTKARLEKRQLRLQETAAAHSPAEVVAIDDVQTRGEGKSLLDESIGSSSLAETHNNVKRLRESLTQAQVHKNQANAHYEKQGFTEALLAYQTALDCLPPRPQENNLDTSDDGSDASLLGGKGKLGELCSDELEVEKNIKQLRATVYGNIAACHLKLEQYKEAVVACTHALADDPLYLKALHRRAQANEQIGTWSSLTSAYEDLQSLDAMPHPDSFEWTLQASLQRLPKKIEEVSAKEKEEMMGKLKGIGNNVLGYFGLSTDNFQMQKQEGGGYSLNFVR